MYSTICHGIQPEVSDTDIYNKLLYCINADPYSLTLGDIVSTEGISVSDKTNALEELQRNQEITSRPNYKAARELFDIDFKQKYGEDFSADPAEEKAKWLRVFHSYIIDKKMEPLDAAEKIRKDYQVAGQEEPHPNPPRKQGGESSPDVTSGNISPGNGASENISPVYGGDKEGVDPTDSLFAGIGKSIVQGTTAFPRTFWGVGAVMEDIAKSIPQIIPLAAFTQIIPEDFFKRRYEDVKGIEERFQAKGEGYKKYVNGAIRTMSEMFSQYVGTAGIGTLPSMSAGAGIGKYLEARKEGYSIPRSFAAGGVTTATEYVTEKTPLEILGRPGLKFIDRLMKGLIADIPGEVEATLVEMTTVDQAILGKSHTRQEYLGALLDTAATAALTTFGATGVTHPFVVGTRSTVSPMEQTEQTEEGSQSVLKAGSGQKNYEGIRKQIGELYEYAISKLSNKKRTVDYGIVDHIEADRIKKATGLDVIGYKRVIDNYTIRHILKGHVDLKTEEARKQTAITKEDIELIPWIIETADNISKGDSEKDVETIAYQKKVNGTVYIYEEMRTGKGELVPTTMYKKRVATNDVPPSRPLKETPSGTSETLRNSSYNTIPPSSESVKPVPVTLTPDQLTIISQMEGELSRGEAPQVLKKETDEGTEYKRTQSTNPEYFIKLHDNYKGISKAYIRNIFKKARNNEPLTLKQAEVLQGLLQAKTEEIDSQKHYVREQLPKITVGELDLNVGDKFKINGEEFLVSEIDEEGNHTIKDGIVYEVDVFDKIPQPDAGSIEKAEAPKVIPALQGLVDTGALSLEDALEIEDVARQNNWSDDTVKQFYKSAAEGLGIQNVETQSLASLLVTARIKAAVYKQDAEKYKQR